MWFDRRAGGGEEDAAQAIEESLARQESNGGRAIELVICGAAKFAGGGRECTLYLMWSIPREFHVCSLRLGGVQFVLKNPREVS
jgi:hypothetical protein